MPLPVSPNVRLLQWDLGAQPWGPGRAVVVVPTWGGRRRALPRRPGALHGRGEAVKSPADGALGWPRDYALVRAFDRLRAPPLREADYEGLAEPARMADANAALARRPFGGLVVVCPWLPDVRSGVHGRRHSVRPLPARRRSCRAFAARRPRSRRPRRPESTGCRWAASSRLRIGLTYPEAFGAVGGIQPAFGDGQNSEWTALAQEARARRPGQRLRLLTSHDDYFHDVVVGVDRAWSAAGIAHEFADVVGPHDYVFNRGPGSLELLFWNDRALRDRV